MFVCVSVYHQPAILAETESDLREQVDHLHWSTAIVVGAERDEGAALVSIGESYNITGRREETIPANSVVVCSTAKLSKK